ncbi:MAG TPA: hypothetical protein VNL73_04885 [Verrucomicrobiae bacterium]|nr:hypothetical protein [Verrucomicrobiae bacterium]
MAIRRISAVVLGAILTAWFGAASGRMLKDVKTQSSALPSAYKVNAACLPNKDQCTHKVGRLWFTVTNYGFFGNQTDQNLRDCLTGGLSSSAEFPGGSRVEYLFQGALWVGAVVAGDTLVSLGTDGWVFDSDRGELHADCENVGGMIKRSRNPNSPFYDSVNAISDQDIIAVMYDTLTDPGFVENPDPQDGKPFRPMGLKVIQKSYSWSAGWGQDWVMLDFNIVNLGQKPLSNVYLGVFVDADVGHFGTPNYFEDDLSGFKVSVPNERLAACPDTINLVYVHDDDGDQINGAYRPTSPTGVTGIRVVRAPVPLNQVKTSFNWWTPNGTVSLDWGPQKVPGRRNFSGGLGQPEGDAMKYHYISNGEFDLDQIWSALNHNSTDYGFGTGWMPPLSDAAAAIDIANGFDTRYVVGYGPFNLLPLVDDPSDTLRLTLGYIAGLGFHRDPSNYNTNIGAVPENLRDPFKIERYQSNLNFQAIATNARWVQRVFDNETIIDTVPCGNPGDSVERRFGDGIPDFKGPQPPPIPPAQVITNQGEILVRWFGKNTENVVDDFSGGLKDFEGYRIQLSPNGQYWTTVGSFDKVDWKVHILNTRRIDTVGTSGTWQPTELPPLSWDEIQQRYAVLWDTCLNKVDSITDPLNWRYTINRPIDPNKYKAPTGVRSATPGIERPGVDVTRCNPDTTKTAIRVRICASCGPGNQPVDEIIYFAPQDYNLGLSQVKLYPSVTDPDNDSSYWYQYKISGLYPGQAVYLALTPFDFGIQTPVNFLEPLEVTPNSAAQLVYPLPNEESRRYSYAVFTYDLAAGSWRANPSAIMNYGLIQTTYAGLWDTCNTRVIDPDKFNGPDSPAPDPSRCNPDSSRRAISIRFCDACGPGGTPVDSLFYFSPSDTFKISVYPNPYRVDHDYSHFENPNNEVRDPATREHFRKLNFINLPAKCVIRIYTLDGDLVQEIRHDKNPNASDAGYESWNLLTRNAQAISAGLYLYTVQSSDGIWTEDGLKNTHVGKIIILK